MCLLIVFICTLFLSYLSYKRYKKFFNPFTLSIQIQLFFLIIPQLILIWCSDGEDSLLSDGVIMLSVFATFCGTYIKMPRIKIAPLRNYNLILSTTWIILFVLLLFLIPILFQFPLSLRGLREFYQYIVFSQFASFYQIAKVIMSFLLVILIVRTRKLSKTIILLCLLLCLSGSKMAIFSTVITLCVLWEEYFKVNYLKLFLTLAIVCIIMIFYHYYQSIDIGDKEAFENAISYFDVYRQQTYALELLTNNKIDFFYGEIALSSWYKIIPRFLWENKPKDFGFALLNYTIYPEYAAEGYMPSFGLAYTFADFGYVSIIISGLLSGLVKNLFRNMFIKNNKNEISCILYVFGLDIVTITMLSIYYFISKLSK